MKVCTRGGRVAEEGSMFDVKLTPKQHSQGQCSPLPPSPAMTELLLATNTTIYGYGPVLHIAIACSHNSIAQNQFFPPSSSFSHKTVYTLSGATNFPAVGYFSFSSSRSLSFTICTRHRGLFQLAATCTM